MSVLVICPCCDKETEDPTPEWVAQAEITEVCSDCERQWYGDESRQP